MAAAATPSQQVLLLDPGLILADDNIRYSRKRSRLDSLKADILEHGGIHTPGEVEQLTPPVDGKKYRLTVGDYRLHAIMELNEQDHADLLFPAIVRPGRPPVDRVRRQLSENLERESMSPLDTATAIKKLLDLDVSKSDIRTIFARPGGKKGVEMIPASNAWLNMTLSFLDLDKPIREKIHLGLVGVAAAYELTKVAPEKRQAVLEKAEADRLKEIEREQSQESKLLATEKKSQEAQAKIDAEKMLLDVNKDELKLAKEQLKAKVEESTKAYSTVQMETDKEAKKIAEEHWLALEADVKGVKKLVADKTAEVTRREGKLTGGSKVADGLKAKLAEARTKTAAKGKGKKVGPTARQVKLSAKAAGEGNKVPLSVADIRGAVAAMVKSSYQTVKLVGQQLMACFDGGPTEKEMIEAVAIIVGDKPEPKVKPQAKSA